MELLILLLLSPTIFAQNYPLSIKSNDEPFLPIFPQYSYNQKLIKRGIERDGVTQLTSELYAPKTDARDSFSASYGNNFQRDSYVPAYNLYSKPSVSAFSPYYASSPYNPTSSPYSTLLNGYPNPYSTSSPYATSAPYAGSSPYSTGSYPNYFYPPAPYPNYYNQPYLPFLPPPPAPYSRPPKPDYDSDDSEDRDSGSSKKSETKKNKYKESDSDSNDNQFVDGGNYISDSKDLDGQSSSYKSPSSYNKLDGKDQQKTIYRIINLSGQQNQDYLLTSNQAKEHLENLMRQTLSKILAQNVVQQARIPYPYNLDSNKNNQNYVAVPGQGIAKTGLSYIINPTVYNKVNPGQDSNLQTQSNFGKNLKYSTLSYGQKPITRVTLDRSPGVYLSPLKVDKNLSTTQTPDYADYDTPHTNSASRNINQEQPQDSVPYSTQNVENTNVPQAFSYHYSSFHPDNSSSQIKTEKDPTDDFVKEKSSR